MNFITLVIALLKALPVLDSWFQKLVASYVGARVAEIKKENRDAIKSALELHDQRPIEEAIGSEVAGKPSGIDGTEIRDSLPGVKP